jgi:hypothetical protein
MPIRFLSIGAATPLGAAAGFIEWAFAVVQGAYMSAPTLMLALTALLVLPAVALLSFAIQFGRRYAARRAALRAAVDGADSGALATDIPDTAALPLRSQAWLTVPGGGTMPLVGQRARIGRHRDNVIRLRSGSVQRHHAVIERTPDESFVIVDVSGGEGVRVNGRRTERAELADGDVIDLGRARLKFEMLRSEDIQFGSRRPVEIEG